MPAFTASFRTASGTCTPFRQQPWLRPSRRIAPSRYTRHGGKVDWRLGVHFGLPLVPNKLKSDLVWANVFLPRDKLIQFFFQGGYLSTLLWLSSGLPRIGCHSLLRLTFFFCYRPTQRGLKSQRGRFLGQRGPNIIQPLSWTHARRAQGYRTDRARVNVFLTLFPLPQNRPQYIVIHPSRCDSQHPVSADLRAIVVISGSSMSSRISNRGSY